MGFREIIMSLVLKNVKHQLDKWRYQAAENMG